MDELLAGVFVLATMKWIAASLLAAGLITVSANAQRRTAGPAVGAEAPVFTLQSLKSDETFSLKDNFGKRPTVLIFGSYT